MKSILLAIVIGTFSNLSYARCVVEIVDSNGDPLGQVFQGESCTEPRARCEAQLRRLNNPEAKCEVTLDIGSKTTSTEN